ncbi:MAG: tagaturonate epimerase family protein [Spirochaetaceae bacterium]|nr:tagaturonate epimerase family protein [Spirochaetaceae bacterium]
MAHDDGGTDTAVTLGLDPSFGFGDRIGLATPGHVQALRAAGVPIQPIFPQQSIREMQRTGRTPVDVMTDALDGMARAGWDGPTGADADHLKTPEDVAVTTEAGFRFFTIDPSDAVDEHADRYGEATLRERYAAVRAQVDWVADYRGRTVTLPGDMTLQLSEEACLRCAVKYGPALNLAADLAGEIHSRNAGRDYEIELSVDETEQPTTLAEHYIIADQCRRRRVPLVALAPRYIGDFEKGVDYKGDVPALERSLREHYAISRHLGPYKLSLHSGSDKLSMYPALSRATEGCFHVKTAGTSYLEALRVVARHDEALFRRIIAFARSRYDTDKATYHVSASVERVPPPEDLRAPELETVYLERWQDVGAGTGFSEPGRQILHCTFGSTLTHPDLGQAVRSVLEAHPDTYTEVLAEHFAHHLRSLAAGL